MTGASASSAYGSGGSSKCRCCTAFAAAVPIRPPVDMDDPPQVPDQPPLAAELQLPQERFRVDGFHHVLIESCSEGPPPVLRLAVRSYCDQPRCNRAARLPQHARHDIPVAIGKADIAQHDVGLKLSRRFEPLLSAMRNHHLIAAQRKEPAQAFSRVSVVLDHEDPALVAALLDLA